MRSNLTPSGCGADFQARFWPLMNLPAWRGARISAELDLLVMAAAKRYGFEFKYADAPGRSRAMHTAIQDLGLEHLWVIYPGHQEYPLDDKISVAPIASVPHLADTLC